MPCCRAAPKAVEEDKDHGQYITDDHVLSLEALAAKFETSINFDDVRTSQGLTAAAAKANTAKYGPNALSPPKKESEWLKFFRHLTNPFLLLLAGAATLSVITYGLDTEQPINLYLGLILYGVILGTAFMGYWKVMFDFSVGARVLLPWRFLCLGFLNRLFPPLRFLLHGRLRCALRSLFSYLKPLMLSYFRIARCGSATLARVRPRRFV